MNDKLTASPPPSLTLADFYYIVFRHKWKIGVLAGLGIVGAMLLPLAWPRPYVSEAKVYIRYVLENRSPNQLNPADSKVKTPDERGDNIINTELEILTSLDLSVAVANEVGPEILAKLSAGADPQRAGGVVRNGLLPDVPKNSNVIRLVFKHDDPSVVQPVLNKLIKLYLEKHAEIHRSMGLFDNFLESETDELRRSLGATEDSLRQAKTNAQIISLEDSKKLFSEQMARVQQAIFDAEAELAERQAAVAELSKLLHVETQAVATNAAAAPATNALSADATVAPGKLAEYKRVISLLETLNKQEQELLLQFTAETSLVKGVKARIVEAEKRKQELETENPILLAARVTEPKAIAAPAGPHLDLITESARVSALNSKIKVLHTQLTQIRKQATTVDEAEGSITSLQRKKDLQEAQYRYFQGNLEQTKVDKALGAGRVSNINVIQAPSPPFRDSSKLRKAMAMLLLGALVAGLALAFVTELYLDRSIRRSNEIEPKLGLPLFITIPRMKLNGKARRLKGVREVPLLADRKNGKPGTPEVGGQRSEVGAESPEVGGQRSEVGDASRSFQLTTR